ncbi:hypothetical protein FOBRF1_004541 [Fusarium oxysporum]
MLKRPCLEPAIPSHLKVNRTQPLHHPRCFRGPQQASHSARFHKETTTIVTIDLGVQHLPSTDPTIAIDLIRLAIRTKLGLHHHVRSSFIDSSGYRNVVFTLYWKDVATYREWEAALPPDWWYGGLSAASDIGVFKELYTVPITDTETTFALPNPEGYSVIAESMSARLIPMNIGDRLETVFRGRKQTLLNQMAGHHSQTSHKRLTPAGTCYC